MKMSDARNIYTCKNSTYYCTYTCKKMKKRPRNEIYNLQKINENVFTKQRSYRIIMTYLLK